MKFIAHTILSGMICAVGLAATTAGEAIIKNMSAASIQCSIDGYSVNDGWPIDWTITIDAGASYQVGPSYKRTPAVINWVDCNGLATRQMSITPTGPDGYYVYTGHQTRTLNVALYPYLPSEPNGEFDVYLQHVINSYQAANPDVLLNLVLNQNLDIYSEAGLTGLLGAQGFDVMELDMLYLDFLAKNQLVTPVTSPQPNMQDIALAAVTSGNQAYAVPSWMCMDFTFSNSAGVRDVTTLDQLVSFLAAQSQTVPKVAANFNGSWRLPAIYLGAWTQTYPTDPISNSLTMPPDPAVIANLTKLTGECAFDGDNNCINKVYHALPDGGVEKVFADENAVIDIGFSEQSFYINEYGAGIPNLYAIPTPWGPTSKPLLYTDAFVKSTATCAGEPCQADATQLITLMTSDAMKSWFVQSTDLGADAPYRRLLVATKSFYQQAWVQTDPLYPQFEAGFSAGQSFPNSITHTQQTSIGEQVCDALKAQNPAYVCSGTPTMRRVENRR